MHIFISYNIMFDLKNPIKYICYPKPLCIWIGRLDIFVVGINGNFNALIAINEQICNSNTDDGLNDESDSKDDVMVMWQPLVVAAVCQSKCSTKGLP